MTVASFFDELPFTPPLLSTPRGDAVAHLVAGVDAVTIGWLASIHRGAGRAALTTIIAAADRHRVTLNLVAKPQAPVGDGGKMLTAAKLEAFYAGFGFVTTGRGDGFARMVRTPGGQ